METITGGYMGTAIVALLFVLVIGEYYWKLKKEIEELVEAVAEAIEDGNVTDIEIARILKEGRDVGRTIKEITFSVVKLLAHR